jgi:hypothetical protein
MREKAHLSCGRASASVEQSAQIGNPGVLAHPATRRSTPAGRPTDSGRRPAARSRPATPAQPRKAHRGAPTGSNTAEPPSATRRGRSARRRPCRSRGRTANSSPPSSATGRACPAGSTPPTVWRPDRRCWCSSTVARGWTGSLINHDPLCRFLSAHAGLRVLSVSYRAVRSPVGAGRCWRHTASGARPDPRIGQHVGNLGPLPGLGGASRRRTAGRPRTHHWLALSRQRAVSAVLDSSSFSPRSARSSASRSVSSSTPCCAQCSIPCCAQSWASLAAVM